MKIVVKLNINNCESKEVVLFSGQSVELEMFGFENFVQLYF